ncbi:MAG: flagellar protein FlgN [Desulfopila sp.]
MTSHDWLVRLLEVIIEERECAKQLDLTGMTAATAEKEQLLETLSHVQAIDEDEKMLVRQIRHENRRNAFLFKSTLGWIRETMEFFGRHSASTTYSKSACQVTAQVNGRLLSGRV